MFRVIKNIPMPILSLICQLLFCHFDDVIPVNWHLVIVFTQNGHHHRFQRHLKYTRTNFQLNLTTLIFVTLMTSPLSTDTSSSFSLKMDITIVSGVIENIPVPIFSLICQLLFLSLWWRHPCQLTPCQHFWTKWTLPSCSASSKTYLCQFSA